MLKEKYGLTDDGVRNVKLGTVWTAVSNLATFGGVGVFYLLMQELMAHLSEGTALPSLAPYALGLIAFIVILFITEYYAYYYQYGVIYVESGRQRIGLAERLRKLPLSFFGRRDLADLTETIMGDVKTIEHAYSHVLPELYGAYVTLAVAAVGLFAFDWRLALASLWSCPVGLALLFGARHFLAPLSRATRLGNLTVSDDIQEALECVREVRATNQEERYLDGIRSDIDAAERTTVKGELANGLCVNGAQIVLRLSLATTVLVGAALVLQGSCDFITLFCFLLVVSRIYAPFDQCLMLIAELFSAQTASARMRSFYEEPLAGGGKAFDPSGHDVVFDDVSFSYGGASGEKVLDRVSFTAKEGEVTALVGPSGSGKSTCSKLAARFWDVTSGQVRVGGVDVAGVDPEVLLGAAAAVWLLTSEPLRAVTVLVVFCPCSLVLATPTAVMAAIGNATRHGFLVKEGGALERLALVRKVVFDKTGTLTEGRPRVSAVVALPASGLSRDELYALVAGAELRSEHPLGRAIVACAAEEHVDVREPEDFHMRPGHGVEATLEDHRVLAGSQAMMEAQGLDKDVWSEAAPDTLAHDGATLVYVSVDKHAAGVIALSDTIRATARPTLAHLAHEGMGSVLLTGDGPAAAAAIASQAGTEEFACSCRPEDKLTYIEERERAGEFVCMVGDGINDAPALRRSYVGVAMGGVGSDVAVDAADIVMISDKIEELPHLVALSCHMMRVIKANLTLSMTLNAVAIVLAFLAVLDPISGALVHNCGSVLVIVNSSLLLGWERDAA